MVSTSIRLVMNFLGNCIGIEQIVLKVMHWDFGHQQRQASGRISCAPVQYPPEGSCFELFEFQIQDPIISCHIPTSSQFCSPSDQAFNLQHETNTDS